MNCSFQNMTTLPAKLLPKTELLIMTGNNLGNLDSVPENFSQIKQLDLNGSNINTINDEALKILLTKSEKLYVCENILVTVPNVLQAEESHTKLWLSDNPYECNCDMMWMRDWLQNATNVMDKGNMMCGEGKWKGKWSPPPQSKSAVKFAYTI